MIKHFARASQKLFPKRGIRSYSGNASTVKEALEFASKNGCEFADLRFCDLLGTQHHIQVGAHMINEGLFDGIGFDGSSIRCWQEIHNSDMLMIPMPESAFVDPFYKKKTLSLRCRIVDPCKDNEPYTRDPRFVLEKAEKYLRSTAVADYCNIGPEAEFFIFDSVRFNQSPNASTHEVNSVEGIWNSNRNDNGANLGYKLRYKEGYFPCPPNDQQTDIRGEMGKVMESLGIEIEAMHHEVGTGGQAEIDFKYGGALPTADKVMDYKYVVRNVAYKHGKTATFMPKPIWGDNGSGMHQHYSLHASDGTNLFTGDGFCGLSELGLHFIGGLKKHMGAIAAFANPTTNSYRRLVPGYEAPTFIAYSGRNRSANMRIPISHPKGRRVELRSPDPTCNPYLTFAAVMQAGLDGILNKIDPGQPENINLFESPEELTEHIPRMPQSLEMAIECLKNDSDFLKAGGVFTEDLLDAYITRKDMEVQELRSRPTPYEFEAYYDS